MEKSFQSNNNKSLKKTQNVSLLNNSLTTFQLSRQVNSNKRHERSLEAQFTVAKMVKVVGAYRKLN